MAELLIKKPELDFEFIAKTVIKLLKRDIFERYKQTGKLNDEDWEFCEKIDWHPVDEFPLKEESIKRMESAKKEKSIKYKSVNEFFDKIG